MDTGYTCHCCAQHKNEIPMNYGTDMPIYMSSMNAHDIKKRVIFTPDACVIDNEHFFLRGNIYISIHDSEEVFSWGVWTSVSETNFKHIQTHWDTEGREQLIEPAFGFLSTHIPLYEDTLNLHVLTHTMPVGQVPLLELEPTNHPLAVEQREGITMARVHEIGKVLRG